MSRIVPGLAFLGFATVLLCPLLLAQSPVPAAQPATFHITGTISGLGGRAATVVFEGPLSKTVQINKAGVYKADLPLGLWTMTVGNGRFLRPPFRVTVPTTLVFDITFPVSTWCGGMIPPPDEAECAGGEFFSVPSGGVPFEVHLWGGRHFVACEDRDDIPACKRAFATYNTLFVQANEILYYPEGILEARSNVEAQDELGVRKADSISFYIHDGQAVVMPEKR
jgi:hypothetical protein